MNTGTSKVLSDNGLLTTVCFALPGEDPVYALEGSVAVTGSLVQWLRDNLGLISTAPEVEALAATVNDNGGAYFVPAFSGLFAPYWRPDARGAIVGLTRFVNRGHLARAALEATAFQTREVVDAMNADLAVARSAANPTMPGAPTALTSLKVDGGMVGNELLMQFQADILDVTVVRPSVVETTALGAAYAAGLAVGFWSSTEEIRDNWTAGRTWEPAMDDARRERLYADWKKAVTKTFDWA
jgi:glycerol kinase